MIAVSIIELQRRSTLSTLPFEPVTVVLDWAPQGLRACLVRSDARSSIKRKSNGAFKPWRKASMGALRQRGAWHPGAPSMDTRYRGAGMIGSRNGWIEMPYCRTPANASGSAAGPEPMAFRKG
ncbi:hypothetical protein F2981_33270 (plasmid) [Sinorhizobium meliloti]|nr:hypothetical protein [Sinorhizobium meliloti]